MRDKRFSGIVLLALFCFILCSEQDVDAEKIPIAYGAIGGGELPPFVTKAAGLFKKHGFDVELVFIGGGSRAVAALISGQTPIIGGNPSGMALAAGRGSDVVITIRPQFKR